MKKSFIRHLLTAVGTLLAITGLDNFIDIVEFINQSIDPIWAAVETIIGFIVAIIGFFKEPERHVEREK